MADNNNPIKYSDLIKPDNSINDLIDQLEELKGVYESALAKVKKEAEQLSNSLKKVSGATKEGRETIRRASEDAERLSNSQSELTKSLNATTKELNLLKSVQQQQNSISKSAENSNKSLGESYEKLNSDADKLTRSIDDLYTALSDVEKTNYDAFIKRSENGMVSYSDVMNKASSNVSRLTSISDQLNVSFDSGNLSIEDYRAAMERVNAGLQKADSVMNQFQESQKGVYDENGRLQESFYGLDTNVQNLFRNLIELQQEQVNTKSSLKELNKEYDSGKISESEFIERAAALTSAMDGQKDAIKKTQTQIKLLNQLNTSAAGSYEHLSAQYGLNKIALNGMSDEYRKSTEEGRKLVAETDALYQEMKRLQEETGKTSLNVGNYSADAQKLTTQIENQTKQLALLRLEGKQNTEEYQRLSRETGILKDALKDATAEVNNMASDTSNLDAVLGAASAASGGFSAYTGIMELAGVESENVEKAQKKLQAAIAVTTGVQAIQNAVQKQSALMLGISRLQQTALTKAKVYDRLVTIQGTKATISATVAQKAFNLIANANPYVLLATALVTVVGALTLFSMGTKDAAEKQERLNREMENANQLAEESARNSGAQLVNFKKMQNAWKEANGDLQKQKKIVRDNKDEFSQLGYEVNTVEQAERLLITNAPAFIEAVKLKARALAGQNLAVKEYERALEAQIKQEQKAVEIQNKQSEEPKVSFGDRVVSALSASNVSPSMGGSGSYISPQELAMDRLENQTKELQKEYNDLGLEIEEAFANGDKYINQSTDDLERYNELVKTINVPVVTPKGINDSDYIKTAEQRKKEIVASDQELAEAKIRNIQDETARLIAETNNQTHKQVEAIKSRVKDISDLSQNEIETIAEIETTGRNRIIQIQKDANEKIKRQQYEATIERLEFEAEQIELSLSAVREGSEKEIDLRKQLLEKQREIELTQNRQLAEDVRQSEADINAKYDNLILQQTTELTKQRELALFDQQQQLEASEFDLLKTSEEAKTRFRLEQEKARLQKILELNEASGIKLSDMEIQTIKNTIARINNEITGSEKGERTKDIYSMIGLNLDDDQKEAINTSVQYAISSITSIMDAKVQAAERAVEAADREVEAAQNALEAEREARANGYANNVEQAQKELDLAKKNQEKALKEQEKAQKKQEAINSLVQASNLVTASAEIFKSFAGIGPWGIPAAIAMIATMWGAFAAAKIKASQLTKGSEEKYGEGTVELLQGGSHQSGNDIDLGTKPDGTRRRAEGGEFFAVINKRNSRRFRQVIPDVIKSLNNGTFTDKYLAAYDGINNISVNLKEKNNDLNDIRNDIREIKNRERTYRDANGDTIITYRNLKRRIKS